MPRNDGNESGVRRKRSRPNKSRAHGSGSKSHQKKPKRIRQAPRGGKSK